MRNGFVHQRTIILFILVLASLLFYQPWPQLLAYSGCGGAIVAAENSTFEAQVVELVNQRRAEQGLPPMKQIPELTDAARYHAADMAQDGYFTHATQDRVNGELTQICSWSARVKSYYTDYWSLGENIAWGYRSPESVMQGWMESSGHRSNILGDYTEIGVGYINNRWVQDFGTRRNQATLIIEREAIQAFVPTVTIYLHGNGQEMRLRNDDQPWGNWQPFQSEFTWTLQNINGKRRVEIEVRSGSTVVSGSDTIVLASATSVTPTPIPTATPIILPPNMDEKVYLPIITK